MAITMLFPKPGTAANQPKFLSRQFVAFGGKAGAGERPVGVMVRTTQPNRPLFVGGRTVFPKHRDGVTQWPDTRWAIRFTMPARTSRQERFKLAVVDANNLGAPLPVVQVADHLAVKGGQRTESRGSRAGDVGLTELFSGPLGRQQILIVEPDLHSRLARSEENVAYGQLPAGNNDIDPNETMFVNPANKNPVPSP